MIEMSEYQKIIHLRSYARWNYEHERRETWEETVDRFCNFFKDYISTHHPVDKDEFSSVMEDIRYHILNLKVVPSMRALMTAGPALERDHIAAFNCSYVPIDNVRAFDEILYISMCGTGVGFSVERQYVSQLPEVPDVLEETDEVIKVADSKRGWAKAYKALLYFLYSGEIPKWDVSGVRPAGAVLKTFGGRASGPQPLVDLFQFTVNKFKKAKGRKLESIEVHDIVCKIGQSVVSGGVRRTALISLSNLSDQRMRDAKSGEWYKYDIQRRLANNSAAYTSKPDVGHFMEEWISLYRSKSGERGIFNRVAAKNKCESIGRAVADKAGNEIQFGTNPCVSSDTWIMTDKGARQVQDLIGKKFKARVDGRDFDSLTGFVKTGTKKLYLLETVEGYVLKVTEDHKIQVEGEDEENWIEASKLEPGDKILINDHTKNYSWSGIGSREEGQLLGYLVGNGTFADEQAILTVWVDNQAVNSNARYNPLAGMMEDLEIALRKFPARSDFSGWTEGVPQNNHSVYRMSNKSLSNLAASYGIFRNNKTITKKVEESSSSFHSGFLRGLFDADGSVQGTQQKGFSVRLTQSDEVLLRAAQRMLLRLGVASKLILDRHPAGSRLMPDQKGGVKAYECKATHELIITKTNLVQFAKVVGFSHGEKLAKLQSILESISPYREKFSVRFKSLTFVGVDSVYDATVLSAHKFDANGIMAHNCAEIILRPMEFCNLSEVIARADDTLESLRKKVEIATIIGTMQSCLTDYGYIRQKWIDNCNEERLLGVSITGVMDCPLLNKVNDATKGLLLELRAVARETNALWASKLNINPSAAITCNKPSGTVSQLANSASGIHGRYANFFIRRIRVDEKDPLAKFLIDHGFPHEVDAMSAHQYVFSFPIKAPAASIKGRDITAINMLELWKMYRTYWCDHNPSVTVDVREDEWPSVGGWVWENFDDIGGVSFMPYDDHVYEQAPYEEITEEQYLQLVNEFPRNVKWEDLCSYEKEDFTTGSQELACVGGACDIR